MTLNEHHDNGLYNMKCRFLDHMVRHMVKDLQRFYMLSVLDRTSYNYCNVHIYQRLEEFCRVDEQNDGNCKSDGEKLLVRATKQETEY